MALIGTIIGCAVLGAAVLILSVKLFVIKQSIREMKEQLHKTRQEGYDGQVRVNLADRDLEQLASEVNRNLDYQKSLKMEEQRSRKALEKSVSDIAHDLRTPLTVVKGNLQMLDAENLSDRGREYLTVSSRKAETLKGMVDAFFELSVLESDNRPVELENVDIIGFLSEFILENETLIREKRLTPDIRFPEKSIRIRGRKDLLSRVFGNLLGNIAKYAKDTFVLSVKETDITGEQGQICLIRMGNRVLDPESIDIDHIFERTYRADPSRSDGSAGLGLYIARLLVSKQKGQMRALMEDDMLWFEMDFLLY